MQQSNPRPRLASASLSPPRLRLVHRRRRASLLYRSPPRPQPPPTGSGWSQSSKKREAAALQDSESRAAVEYGDVRIQGSSGSSCRCVSPRRWLGERCALPAMSINRNMNLGGEISQAIAKAVRPAYRAGGRRCTQLWESFVFFSEQGESRRGAGAVSRQGVSIGPWTAEAMKIQKANAGALTNFEVLDFLRSRGAKVDPMGCLGAVAASECKVYEYLLKTPACNQTRESIYEFAKRSEGFRLADADKLNVINWRPSSAADAYAMIEECGRRFSKDERGETCNEDERVQEFLDMVEEVLPAPPPKAEAEAMQE